MIRPISPKTDAAAIATIYGYYVEHTTATFDLTTPTEAEMEALLTDISKGWPGLVWEEDGHMTGYCYAHPWKQKPAYDKTLETTIYLAPESTGRGIGRKLMKRLIDECRERGFKSLIACITAENSDSCRFHQSLGFKKVSDFTDVGEKFGRMLSVVDFQLQISSSGE